MLFMVIERFKNRDAKAVYRRFRDHGRSMPDGLRYVNSWIESWTDLIEFEIVPVVPSAETREAIEPLL